MASSAKPTATLPSAARRSGAALSSMAPRARRQGPLLLLGLLEHSGLQCAMPVTGAVKREGDVQHAVAGGGGERAAAGRVARPVVPRALLQHTDTCQSLGALAGSRAASSA